MGKVKRCSFCGANITSTNIGLEGIGAIICHQCLDLYSEISQNRLLNDDDLFLDDFDNVSLYNQSNSAFSKKSSTSPISIYKELSKRVIGQDNAKKILSVALYRHYKRINALKEKKKISYDKSNILMIGPSGSGKTLLAKIMADIISVPFAIVDATVYTQAGYVGEDVENILLKLLENANYDLRKAETGIIFIDEFDKIARKGENPSITRDVSGEGVQNSLLKIIEGNIVNVPPMGGRKHPRDEYIKFDTTNVLFICAGAFSGIERIENSKLVGYNQFENPYIDISLHERLTKYGIIPEILGRLSTICTLSSLSKNELFECLTTSEYGIINEYINLFKSDNIDLTFSNDSLYLIASYAYNESLGARALKIILDKIMLEYMYNTLNSSNLNSNKHNTINISCDDVYRLFGKQKNIS